MAIAPQNYPRIDAPNTKQNGLLDVDLLKPHTRKLVKDELKTLIRAAIQRANEKSSRETLSIPSQASNEEIQNLYERAGKDLLSYFKKYCSDPASTAHQVYNKHHRNVGIEQFRNRTVQKGRMNSGWRYQFLIHDCANQSNRFHSISGIGTAEGDFNAIIEFIDETKDPLHLYVSVKNRKNTMGGQDWPKAIEALERFARSDKNRSGPYCCVFAIAMDRGERSIKVKQSTDQPHSFNTEVWLSDFVWPFFANCTYEEIMSLVLEVLLEMQQPDELIGELEIPEEVLTAFGLACHEAGLVNEDGIFDDPYKLVSFFCS